MNRWYKIKILYGKKLRRVANRSTSQLVQKTSMGSNGKVQNDSWESAFKEQIIWFIFAVLLAGLTSYAHVRLSVNTVGNNLARAEEKIGRLQERQDRIDDNREQMRIRLERISQKLDLILRSNGIDPNEITQESNE